jgi:FixJ family two-component response regulator
MSMNTATQSAVEFRSSMPDITPIVYIVDDDISIRESLEALVASAGLRPKVFASAQEFLTRPRTRTPGCLILDVSLPDLNGLELQKRIGTRPAELPVIFITGFGDIPTSVQAMKAGAVEFLTKPFDTDTLLAAIEAAIARSRADLAEDTDLQILRKRLDSLSRREREVMELVVRGRLNKQVGAELDISEITVKAHRGRMMKKMRARSLADLVNMASRLQLPTAHGR